MSWIQQAPSQEFSRAAQSALWPWGKAHTQNLILTPVRPADADEGIYPEHPKVQGTQGNAGKHGVCYLPLAGLVCADMKIP